MMIAIMKITKKYIVRDVVGLGLFQKSSSLTNGLGWEVDVLPRAEREDGCSLKTGNVCECIEVGMLCPGNSGEENDSRESGRRFDCDSLGVDENDWLAFAKFTLSPLMFCGCRGGKPDCESDSLAYVCAEVCPLLKLVGLAV